MEGMPEDMWTPYKYLHKIIQKSLSSSSGANVAELDLCLKKYKQTFGNLLRNPSKNEHSRNQLKHGINEGVSIPGHGRPMLLSKDLVDESIIISDMFDLDEYLCMELLCSAQRQMSQHPGLPRGLVAVLLYYDGRKAIAYSLRDLFQATSGVSWVTNIPKEISQLISTFTQSLVDDYIILNRIIDLLESMDMSKEVILLTKNRALGTKKHRSEVMEMFEEIRTALAVAFFNWSAQRGLSKSIVVRLIQYFPKYKTSESSGNIDDVTTTMLMAYMYSCDTRLLLRHEESSVLAQKLPVLSEQGFAPKIYETLTADKDSNNNRMYTFMKFTFGLTLSSLRQIPQNLQNSITNIIERDEQLIDDCITAKIFDFIYYYILEKDLIYRTEFFYRRVHLMFTDFIDFMHSKVAELRGRADETARTVISYNKEGLDPPPNLDHNFEMLMLCIGKFYQSNRCGLALCVDYWGPMDVVASSNVKITSRSVSLFKFIRLAGELLPSTLFVSYLKMIAGLSSCERSARNTFNLLKQVPGLTGSATLSWDHFFASLMRYYTNLRREQCPGSDTIYRNRILNRSINPQEIDGLQAVLGVIGAVAAHDEVARVAICEHPNWTPIHVLLGLLSCSVPINLKAEIVKTLSALAKSKETAIQLWNYLEASQIIATVPSTSAYLVSNLEIEIDQNECRIETFPISQSILDMFNTLVTMAIPKNLGAGPRKPGFDPYLTFIINGIFLKFYNRSYRNAGEKWEVGEKGLRLLVHLLKLYHVQVQDFNEESEQNPPPGFHIMLLLNTKSELLRLLLLIIDDAVLHLEDYNKFVGKEKLEDCALHCLHIVEIALTLQNAFFDLHSMANSSKFLIGLNKMLLDVNPRSRQPDHLLNITKFVTYGNWIPWHALRAIKILKLATSLPNINTQLFCLFTRSDETQVEIRHGFVECLEGDDYIHQGGAMSDGGDGDDNSDGGGDGATNNEPLGLYIKENIISLIQNNLKQPAPNIAHFLLGFDVTRDNINQLQSFIVIESSSNCTKSLVSLLDNHLETRKSTDGYNASVEMAMEKAYGLLYSLCANQKTSDTILLLLRNCNDFLYRHASALPFKHCDRSPHVLWQMSYLLKCIAIELKLTADSSQISRFQYLCKLLVGYSDKTMLGSGPMELNQYCCHNSGGVGVGVGVGMNASGIGGDVRDNFDVKSFEAATPMLLCHLLDCLQFQMRMPTSPKWEYFDHSITAQAFHECEFKSENGPKLINLKRLHGILHDELCTVQNAIATGPKQLIMQELEAILLLALDINNERNKTYATVRLLDSWGQVTEMLFSGAPDNVFPTLTKQELILKILQKILSKVVPVQAIFELAILASGTVLSLLVNFRYCHYQNTSMFDVNSLHGIGNASTMMELNNSRSNRNNSCNNNNNNSSSNNNQNNGGVSSSNNINNNNNNNTIMMMGSSSAPSTALKANALSLKFILRNILEWILMSEVQSQKLRINLYTSLLNCMYIARGKTIHEDTIRNDFYVSCLDKSIGESHNNSNSYNNSVGNNMHGGGGGGGHESSSQIRVTIEVFKSFGEKLLDIICHDCIAGHDVCKISALSCIATLLNLDSLPNVINFVANRGYLTHIVDSIMKSDDELCGVLQRRPENMRALYVYESQMAMLLHVANSHVGAELLLANKILGAMATMRVFDMHPDIEVYNVSRKLPADEFIPTPEARYRQILFPAISLCDSIVSTLGPENHSAISQIVYFLLSHCDIIETILRSGSPFMDLGLLQELSAITSLIARTINQELLNVANQNSQQEVENNLYRLQRLMLALFSRFILSDATLKKMFKGDNALYEATEQNKSLHVRYFLEIAANLALYCRNAVSNHSADHRTTGILFAPQFNETIQQRLVEAKMNTSKAGQSLGDIIFQLKASVEYYNAQRSIMENFLRQRSALPSFSIDEKAKTTYFEINNRLYEKQIEINHCSFITEQCLYLLWSHLDFYMRRAIAGGASRGVVMDKFNATDAPNYLGNGLLISRDDINALKKNLVAVFNETFSKQLLQTVELNAGADRNFTEALLRRIKSLIQFVPTA